MRGSIRINGWTSCVFLSVIFSQFPDQNSSEVPVIAAPAPGKLLLRVTDLTVDFIDALRGCCCTEVVAYRSRAAAGSTVCSEWL